MADCLGRSGHRSHDRGAVSVALTIAGIAASDQPWRAVRALIFDAGGQLRLERKRLQLFVLIFAAEGTAEGEAEGADRLLAPIRRQQAEVRAERLQIGGLFRARQRQVWLEGTRLARHALFRQMLIDRRSEPPEGRAIIEAGPNDARSAVRRKATPAPPMQDERREVDGAERGAQGGKPLCGRFADELQG